MRAKDYFEKHEEKLLKGDVKDISDLFIEMIEESQEILKQRKCKSNSAVAGIVREMNDKWNAVVAMFEKKHQGLSPLKRDGLKNYFIQEIPDMARYLTPCKQT